MASEDYPGDVYDYGYVITFNWSPDAIHPFQVFPVEDLVEMKSKWLERRLNFTARKRLVKFEALQGQDTSVFVKVEKSK